MSVLPEQGAASAYVHLPFCLRKCRYCDFVSYPGRPAGQQAAYVEALLREIRSVAGWIRQAGSSCLPLQTVFFGGGTPSVLPAGQLARILDQLAAGFGLDPAGEFTFEANPGTVSPAGLKTCRAAGFNRISFGLQACQPHLLDLLGRIHTAGDFFRSVEWAAAAGFQSINADIMFGLPGQTLADVAETVEKTLALPVDHLSFYALSLEEGTPLYEQCRLQPGLLPDENLERAQYHLIRRLSSEQGLEQYEISSSARPGHRCRHNLVYWRGLPYYGFGAAAHAYLGGIRRANPPDLDAYLGAWADEAADPWSASQIMEIIDRPAAMKEMLMLGLRLIDGVRFADFQKRFGESLLGQFAEPVGRLVRRGLLLQDEQGIRLSLLGLDLGNQVFQEFV